MQMDVKSTSYFMPIKVSHLIQTARRSSYLM